MSDRRGYDYAIDMEVREYECDLQGIVNNAVYLNYLEHARHRHLLEHGVDFTEMASRGLNLVVTRFELDYLRPLRPGDAFRVGSSMTRVSRLRFRFDQGILLLPEGQPVMRALLLGTVIGDDGRPVEAPELAACLEAGDDGCGG